MTMLTRKMFKKEGRRAAGKKGGMSFFVFAFMAVFLLSVPRWGICDERQDVVDTKENDEVFLYEGDLVSLKVYSLTRIAVSKTGVVEISNVTVDEVLLIGQSVGETTIFVWDEYGKRAIVVRVLSESPKLVMTRLEKLLDSAGIKGVSLEENKYEGKIVATGKVTKKEKETVSGLFENFSHMIIDMVKEAGDLVQIDVQITELSTTIAKEIGIDWTSGGEDSLVVAYPEGAIPTQDGGMSDLFKIGDFSRTSALLATVNALISEGKGRLLSNPSLVVTEGEEASFNVGGEIPIRTTTVSAGATSTVQENITFRSYGVTVTVTPNIKDGKIDITLDVDIKDIDRSTAVGDDVGFTTRTMQTKVFLNDGQTIVIAGLIKTDKSQTVSRVPFISKLPIVGWLFRTTNAPSTDLEVVISLTPKILGKEEKEEAKAEEKEEIWGLDKEDFGQVYELKKPDDEVFGAETEDFFEPEIEKATMAETEEFPDEFLELKKELAEWEESEQREGIEEEIKPAEREEIEDIFADTDMADMEDDDMGDDEMEDAEMEYRPAVEDIKDFFEAAPSPKEDIPNAVTAYAQTIQQRISQSISFPYEAKQRGWAGKVTLTLTVLSDGSLNDVSIKESSGHDVFDKDAVNTTQILAPFDPFPAEISLEELVLTVPIVYSQEAVLGIGATETIDDGQ